MVRKTSIIANPVARIISRASNRDRALAEVHARIKRPAPRAVRTIARVYDGWHVICELTVGGHFHKAAKCLP